MQGQRAFKHFWTSLTLIKTEREGFEPSTEVASCNSLAGSRFQPLSHLSSSLTTLSRTLALIKVVKGNHQKSNYYSGKSIFKST